MPQELKNLSIEEVSCVDRGANRTGEVGHARIALFKRDAGGETPSELLAAHKISKAIDGDDEGMSKDGKTQGGATYPKRDFAYTPDEVPSHWKLRLTMTPGGKPDAGIVGAAVAALGKGFRGKKVQIPASALASVKAKVRAAWRAANADKDSAELPDILKGETTMAMTIEEIEAKVTKQDTELAVLKSANEALVTENEAILKMSKKEKKCYAKMSAAQRKDFMAADMEKRATMIKGMKDDEESEPDADDEEEMAEAKKIAKLLKAENLRIAKSAADEKQSLLDRVTKAETAVNLMAEARKVEHFIDVAKRELPNSSGSDADKGDMLMKMADGLGGENADVFKKALAQLKAADAALGEKHFVEIGKSGGEALPAEMLIQKQADEIRKSDPKMTSADAYAKAMDLNPQLYKQYDEERRARVRKLA